MRALNSPKLGLLSSILLSGFLASSQIEEPCNLSVPEVNDLNVCGPGTYSLNAATDAGDLFWYSDLSAPPISVGPTLETPMLFETTDYFVRSVDEYAANWSFDTGLEGWTNAATCPGLNQPWAPVNDGGVFGIKAENFGSNSSQLILSPVLDANSGSSVDFQISHRFNTETCCDHGNVIYRINGGPWLQFIFDVNAYNVFDFMYNDPIFGDCGNSPDLDCFAGDSGGYLISSGSAAIPPGATTIQFGFLFTTDASFADDGWYINSALATIHCQTEAAHAAVNILPRNEAPTALDAVLCGPGVAELIANSNTLNTSPEYNWYPSPLFDSPVFTGNPLSTSISETTVFKVEEIAEGGELDFLQTFDDGLGSWTAEATCGLSINWETTTDQGRNVMRATSPGGNSSMLLSSQMLDVSTNEDIYFSFKHRYNTETCCDHGYVVYKLDGADWEFFTPEINTYDVFDFMYNDPILGGCGFSPDTTLFAGDSGGYLTSAGIIDATGANTLQVGFLYTSDASFTDEGWFIDEVRLLSQEYCPSELAQVVAYVSDQPSDPLAEDVPYCPGSTLTLLAESTSGIDPATLNWFDLPVDGTLLNTGNSYEFTPGSDQTIYVQESAVTSLNWSFDTGLEGWTTISHCGNSDLWAPVTDGEENTMKATQIGSGNSSMSLLSPVITTGVAASIDISFNHRFNTETCCDHGYVLYRIDDGEWQVFTPAINPPNVFDFQYNDPYLGDCGSSPDMMLFAGDSGGYITSSGTIQMEGGNRIQLSFFYSSDASFVDDGWYVNSVTVEGIGQDFGCASNRIPIVVSEVSLDEPVVSVPDLCFPSNIFMSAQSGSGLFNTSFNWYNAPDALIPINTGSFYSIFTDQPLTFYVEEVYPIRKTWNFDNDLEGWTATSECALPGTWIPEEDDGEGTVKARQQGSGNSSMLLTSPVVELNATTSATFSYNHRYNTETCCDHGYVVYRLDGGAWEYFEPTFNTYTIYDFMYNDPINGACGVSPDTLVYAGDSNGYITSSGAINTLGANTLEVAFLYTSDASFVDDGWYINRVDIEYFTADCSSVRVPAEINVSHYGCTDSSACNYDPAAGCNSGACVYSEPGCGNCVASDGRGVDFYDYYAPNNWTVSTGLGNGSVTHNPGSVSIVGTNQDGSGSFNVLTEVSINAELTGTYSFSWSYYTSDGPNFDPAYYINGAAVTLTSPIGSNEQGGFISFEATAGDVIGFGVDATDGCCGEGMLLITNFKYPVIPCGCTDALACNYDPSAIEESGQCCYDNCIQLEMLDSFGDGWNGATYVIANNATDEVVAQGTMQNGSIQLVDFCLQPACYSITVGGGTFDSEISWTITGADGGPVAGTTGTIFFGVGGISCSGCLDNTACNYSPAAAIDDGSCCFENCIILELFDSFGDGWNGGQYEITDESTGLVVASGTLLLGLSQEFILCVADGCYSITAGGGSFPGEISWILSGSDQGTLSGVANDIVPFGVGNSGCFGCTDILACNYDPDAEFDDGSCEAPPCSCLGDLDNSGDIGTADLLILLGQYGCNASCSADLDGNDAVGTADLLVLLGVFGTICP